MVLSAPSLSHHSSSLQTNQHIRPYCPDPEIVMTPNEITRARSTQHSPVALVRRRNVRRVSPHTHLQDSDKQQRVYSEEAKRDCDPHDFPRLFGGIAEVVCVRKRLYMAVQSDRPLDREIRQNPVSRCKRARLPHEAVHETPNSYLLPRHVEMIKPKIVVVLKPRNVKPVVENHSYPTQLQQAHRLQ